MQSLTNLIRQQWGKLPSCNHCKTPVHSLSKLCGGACGATFYCNQQCQKMDWQNHKTVCQKIGVKTDQKRGRDDGDDDERRVRQKPEEENVIDFSDLVNQAELNNVTAWKLVLRFLNLEDLKNVSQTQNRVAKLARQQMLDRYWVKLPEDLDYIPEDYMPILRNVIVDSMIPLDFLRNNYPKVFDSIRKLKFGWRFNQRFRFQNLPQGLTHLTFDGRFNRPLPILPEGLTHLKFGDSFDQPLLLLPHGLTHLTFGDSFNQSLENVPQGLTHLELGHRFNQSLENLPRLTHLTYRDYFNRPLQNLPTGLTHLTLGHYFNQPLENLPRGLTHLTFGWKFNQSLQNLPQGLTHLTLGHFFNQPLQNLPKNLFQLIIGSSYTGVVPDDFVLFHEDRIHKKYRIIQQ